MAVFLVKVLEDQPSEVFHYPGARISDLLVVNHHSVGWYHGISPGNNRPSEPTELAQLTWSRLELDK